MILSFQSIMELFDIITDLGNVAKLTARQAKKLQAAESSFRQSYAAAAKRANVRLAALEEKGFTSSPAYQRATWFTAEERDRLRFSESKKQNLNDMMRAYEEINIFLESESSTVAGERRREAGLNKIMPDASKKEQNAMIRFLESSAFEEMKKTIGTDIVKKAADAIEAGAKVSDLNKLFRQFKKQEAAGQLTVDQDIYTEVWTKWTDEE